MKFEKFIAEVEQYAKKSVLRREDVLFLLESAESRDLAQVFMDIVFQAKFLTRTREILARVGQGGEGYDTLSRQFAESLEKTSTLTRTLIKEAPPNRKEAFAATYFSLQRESLETFMELLADLALIKNWEVDGREIPLSGYVAVRRKSSAGTARDDTGRDIVRLARLALVLLVLLLLIDGPYTILGWITAVMVSMLILIIHVLASRLHQTFKERR